MERLAGTLRAWHLAVLRYAVTLDNADRLAVFRIAREIDIRAMTAPRTSSSFAAPARIFAPRSRDRSRPSFLWCYRHIIVTILSGGRDGCDHLCYQAPCRRTAGGRAASTARCRHSNPLPIQRQSESRPALLTRTAQRSGALPARGFFLLARSTVGGVIALRTAISLSSMSY
jgi:hypothetical protein